jgi:hypothetical protein
MRGKQGKQRVGARSGRGCRFSDALNEKPVSQFCAGFFVFVLEMEGGQHTDDD